MTSDHQPAAPTAPAALVSATQVAEIVKENKQGVAVVDVRDAQVEMQQFSPSISWNG
jgi:hypothetical protein